MRISFDHKFVFVHVPKAAGSSVREALTPYAVDTPKTRWNKFVSDYRLRRDLRRRFYRRHMTARQLQDWLPPETFAALFKFTFVRNPWDRLYSMYNYVIQSGKHHRQAQVKRLGFSAYIDAEIQRGKFSQLEMICDDDGKFLVSFIGRFEQLEADFATVIERLGINAILPRANASHHADYRQAYSKEDREKVARHWHEEIARLGYTFEGIDPSVPLPRG